MKKFAFILLYMSLSVASAADFDESLEPCMNGGVSATGNYSSQEQEDTQRVALEPCINGGVSATGKYSAQEKEDYIDNALSLTNK